MLEQRIHLALGAQCNQEAVLQQLHASLKKNRLDDRIQVYCHTLQDLQKPACGIYPERIFYENINENLMRLLVEVQILKNTPIEHFQQLKLDQSLIERFDQWDKDRFFYKQTRIVLKNAGKINPEDIQEAIAMDAYQALVKVLTSMSAQAVIDEITAAGLRGRGGGGFPTGRKWQEIGRASCRGRV